MPVDQVQQFCASLSFRLDPFQMSAVKALSEGRSVLVAAPTGTGKTVVAEFAVHLALSRGLRAMYTTPIKALSNQKFRDFRARYGDEVGLMTGDLVENPSGRLLVMTTEVARNMLVQDPGLFQDVGCLIFDEVHYLADPERGTAWEESILLAPPHVPLVCLSATVANAAEVADWIRTTGRDVALVESFDRAVPLKHRYYLDGALLPILEAESPVGNAIRGSQEHVAERATAGGNGSCAASRDAGAARPPEPPEVVRSLARDDLLPAIYFLFSRKAVEEAAESCQRLSLLPHRLSLEVRRAARDRLRDLPPEDRSLDQVERLLALLPRGIGFHHAGMLPPLKTLVEELLAAGMLKMVFATDTLALGINVPARSVVVGEMAKFDGQSRRLILPGEYRQITGRAGRRGMDPVGYAVLLHSPWVGLDRTLEIATGDLAPLESAFRPGYSTVLNLWTGPGDEERPARLIAGSLRQYQQGSRIRLLARERDDLSSTLAGLPTGCPLDGGEVNWLQRDRLLRREHEQAESALESARRSLDALQQRLSAWPWHYTRNQKKEWLHAARPGELAYSRRRGWVAYLGPSSQGIGLFLSSGGTIAPLASHADLDYLPEPALQLPLPAAAPTDLSALASAMESLPLPDVEGLAREAAERARAANARAISDAERRVSAADERLRAVGLSLTRSPCRACHLRADHRRLERQRRGYAEQLTAVERELDRARVESRRGSERLLRALRSVLESFGYMSAGRPTAKAAVLRRLFDSNSLIISELLDWGVLSDASAAEIAEVASWFAFDRNGTGRALPLTERLARIRGAAEAVAKRVVEVEHRFGLSLSVGLAPEFRGVALAWATGATLAQVSERSALAEGDVVFALQKTIDLCRQIAQAARHSRSPSLSRRAAEAERLLRRGVLDSYYRWVVGKETPSPEGEGQGLVPPGGCRPYPRCAHATDHRQALQRPSV